MRPIIYVSMVIEITSDVKDWLPHKTVHIIDKIYQQTTYLKLE